MSRGGRRALGSRRRLKREAHADVRKILELSEEGRPPRAVASSVGLPEEFVQTVLREAEAVRNS